jgi:deoxyribodipyrimidine photo-lyase
MRELNTTGYLHNRGRLIVSNFLTRILQQNWHEGEYHFARVLYDYDPAQNSFGWQISASISGTASRPINQNIYNPWIQSAKFDKEGKYIKHWLPELSSVEARKLHKWDKYCDDELAKGVKYLAPIVDYAKEREYNLKMIK